MNKTIPSFFIFSAVLILYAFDFVEFSPSFIALMLSVWSASLAFDIYTTFQRRELLSLETNPIIRELCKRTTVPRTIALYCIFEAVLVVALPLVVFHSVELGASCVIAMFFSMNHVIAGMSNRRAVRDFDNRN